ncbi:hypothetical protein BGZ88_000790 [Linnemannia elongata]|nr:hypothetical protein BGZ88_000790 [Linnemannia elongata]
MELYISGEYSGTFRGESFLPSDPSFTPVISGPGGTGAANNVDPTATTTTAYNDVSTTPASHISSGYFTSSSQNFENQTSPNFSAFASAHPYMMSPGISTSIDLDKVRQMLSQVQIDNMPQATVAAAAGETAAFVTKAELALMEERIMTKIEQQFQEMEDRILNKLLLATKLPNA